MISFFIDGMYHDYMKMKIMRDKLCTLQEAITVAPDEQNLRRFDLRSGNHTQRGADHANFGAEPMDVRPRMRCQDLKVKVIRSRTAERDRHKLTQ